MSRLISQSELARWGNVSRNTVNKATKPGGVLYDTVVEKKIDVDHPLALQWLRDHGVVELPAVGKQPAPKRERPKAPATAAKADDAPTEALPYDLEDLENLTVREVVFRYGSVDGFKRFVDSLKNIAEYKHRELRVRTQRGELIERSAVAGVIFPMIDVAFARLVSDVPESVSKQVIARVEAGGPDTNADVVQLIRDANSRVLKNVKQSTSRLEILKDAN